MNIKNVYNKISDPVNPVARKEEKIVITVGAEEHLVLALCSERRIMGRSNSDRLEVVKSRNHMARRIRRCDASLKYFQYTHTPLQAFHCNCKLFFILFLFYFYFCFFRLETFTPLCKQTRTSLCTWQLRY